MSAIRILHTGDWHLRNSGTIAGKFASIGDYNELLIDARNALDAIVGYATENEIDLVVISGDIFDYPKPEKEAIKVGIDIVDGLGEVAPVVIVRGNPNHEGGGSWGQVSSLNVFRNRRTKFGIFVSDVPETFRLFHRSFTARIFTLPYPPKSGITGLPQYRILPPEQVNSLISKKVTEVVRGFHAWIEKECVNVFVGHFTVAGGSYSPGQLVLMWDVSVPVDVLEPFDVVCLGHLHMPQPMYSGSIAQGGFGDEDMTPGFRVIEVDVGERKVVEDFRVPVPYRKYRTVQVEDVLAGKVGGGSKDALRIKGSLKREDYEKYLQAVSGLPHRFVKNSVELIGEDRARCGAIGADMATAEAFEAWLKLQEKKGYMERRERLLVKLKGLEEGIREATYE